MNIREALEKSIFTAFPPESAVKYLMDNPNTKYREDLELYIKEHISEEERNLIEKQHLFEKENKPY